MAITDKYATVPLTAGERVNGLNHVAALRSRYWGESGWQEITEFITRMRDKRDPCYEDNNRALAALFFLARIPITRHESDVSALSIDEKRSLILAMNQLRAVVSLFPKRLSMPV